MAKKSELQRALDHIDGQIAELQRARAAITATQQAISKVKPSAVRKSRGGVGEQRDQPPQEP